MSDNIDIRDRDFFSRDSEEVAQELLGDILVKDGFKGRITETEAYYGENDSASHAYNGKTERNEIMFGVPGKVYVYLCYGVYYLLNITTRSKGRPGAVLIRSIKPLEGVNEMKINRGVEEVLELTTGPGKLTKALGVDKRYNGCDVTQKNSKMKVLEGGDPSGVSKGPRVGVDSERKLRFFLSNSDYVS